MEGMKNSAGNRGGRYSADVACLRACYDVDSSTGATGALPCPCALQGPRALGHSPGARGGRVAPVCRICDRRGSGYPLLVGYSNWWPALEHGAWRQIKGHQWTNVPRYLPKANFSHPVPWDPENFQPIALATPLYSINFRLIGGGLSGCVQ
jgi:hypothetical protein